MPGATGFRVFSDLFHLANFVQQTCVSQGKNLIIDALRAYFKKDVFYRYETDAFGFPLTPNLTDLPPDIEEQRTTRMFIGDVFRYDIRYLPSITVRHSSAKYYPISMNQNVYNTKYRVDLVLDGYGNQSYIRTPTHHTVAGAWDQSFEIIIASESTSDREELSDIVSSFIIGVARQELYEAGLFIKSVSLSSEKEEEFGNEKIYIQSLSVEAFSEWRREIPVSDLMEVISFCFNYGLFDGDVVTDTTFITTI